MGDYQQWEEALTVWVTDATGLTVQWENRARAFGAVGPLGPLMMCVLSGPSEAVEQGTDWVEWADGVPLVRSLRIATYSVRVITRDQRSDQKAGAWAERARRALALPQIRAAFRAAGMAIVRAEGIRLFDAARDGRTESIAAFEVTFNVEVQDNPAVLVAADGWIDRVTGDSNLEPAGTPPNGEFEVGPV